MDILEDILEDFIDSDSLPETPKPKYLIKDIEMPVRLRNSLERLNFNYLEEVIKLSETIKSSNISSNISIACA